MILIGSQALRSWCGEFPRPPADVDLVGTFAEFKALIKGKKVRGCHPTSNGSKYVFTYEGTRYEFEIAWPGTSAEALCKLVKEDNESALCKLNNDMAFVTVPSIHILYALKMTHRFKKNSVHFLKTMRDIQFMRDRGATLKEEHKDFYKFRLATTLDYAHPKLNVSAKEFFVATGDVVYVYQHDSIHEAIKVLSKPAYAFFKKDEDEIWNSREMFENLPEAIKRLSVIEEAYVLALERSQIPHRGKISPHESFIIAMMKVCTNISSGWWREYAWENYDRIIAMYDDSYVERFWSAQEMGLVKLAA